MGMYDELVCEYPLPDGFDHHGIVFQTKDTPHQYLSRYRLTAEGVLYDCESGMPVPLHGVLRFYADNLCASGPAGVVTVDDTPPWYADYCALFDHGTLVHLSGQRCVDTSRPQITRAAYRAAYVTARS